MNFIEAMIKLEKNQGYVRRVAWGKVHPYQHLCKYNGEYYHHNNNRYYNFTKVYQFTSVDYLANDWEIYEEERELHTFEEALKALKLGAKIYRKSRVAQVHKKSDKQFLFYDYDDFEANDWIIIGGII